MHCPICKATLYGCTPEEIEEHMDLCEEEEYVREVHKKNREED